MSKFFHLSPLTKKRLERFRRSRVANWSLKLLVVLYLLSLCAELICNSKPLMMRYNGEWFFPFLRSCPPDAILQASGQKDFGDSDYRKFVASPAFTQNEKNFVLFAPVRFSPGEIIDPSELEKDKRVTLSLVPQQPVGRFNLTAEGRLVRQDNCAQFFPGANLRDEATRFDELATLSPELQAAITRRFKGEACGSEAFTLTPHATRTFPWQTLHLTLSPSAGGTCPATLRINLRRSREGGALAKLVYVFSRTEPTAENPTGLHLETKRSSAPEPSPELKEKLFAWAQMGFERSLVAADNIHYIAPDGTDYTIFSDHNIHFPFPPTREHIFGLDSSGCDVFSRIVYATRIAMSFGLLLAMTATILGMIIGSIQGYFGGKTDIAIQRFTEIWASLPFLYIMVLVGSVFGQSFWLLLLVYGLFCWIGLSYYMRAEFLRLRDRPFVSAARCQGLSHSRIIFRHILPNALTPIITLFPFLLVGSIGALVSLDFLGFGLPPLTPSWGELLNQAQNCRWAWWLILFPSLAIFTVMFLTVMVGEGVRNAFDPKPFSKLQ